MTELLWVALCVFLFAAGLAIGFAVGVGAGRVVTIEDLARRGLLK